MWLKCFFGMHVTIDCFAARAAIDQIMYFTILCGDTELRLKKMDRNSKGVWIFVDNQLLPFTG
jgi:hypothetical protein